MCSWVTPNKHICSPLCSHHVTIQPPEMSLEGDVSLASPAALQEALPEDWDLSTSVVLWSVVAPVMWQGQQVPGNSTSG